jgi:phthiocerol/phenolphthiocerol synthesis type-I polyketide synthase E
VSNLESGSRLDGVAIIGMSGRFPGAVNIEQFWKNLCAGVESISFFSDQELENSGVPPAELRASNYVKARGVLDDIEMFDASFFGYTPREAEIIDPQHRLFLECAWEAFENAGYDVARYSGPIGVYAGASLNTYLLNNLGANPGLLDSVGTYQMLVSSDKDYLATRIAYKLDLKGPSITVQTACSTSLVAASLACQSLLTYQCDMALAGGVAMWVPHRVGYAYQEGGILSPDGHCRAFDAKAQGTVVGNGVGAVVLKRLEDALHDGDHVYAVIKGFAINNDGAAKVGFTAPGVKGQARVIAEALALADVKPETITYIETHGTGTPLGDPIEFRALNKVFQASTKGSCALGSVKTNIGHLDAAAGVASLIKTALTLKHKHLPPSLHFEHPNPKIDMTTSPFYVNTKLCQWQTDGNPRRAGVSSFGIGGTNAHMVLEESLATPVSTDSRPWQLLLLSAKTNSALEVTTSNLVAHLKVHPDLNLADVAFTCQVGRKAFEQRRMLVFRDLADATTALETSDPKRVFTRPQSKPEQPIVFMFTGQGAQYVNMGLELYQTEPVFREAIDRCTALLRPHLGFDLRDVLYPDEAQVADATERLTRTAITQPALFVVEYALAKQWQAWGIRPRAMIGHSIGEYMAAHLAGVFSLEDALALVVARGHLMQGLPTGAMLSVSLSEQEIGSFLKDGMSLAVSNGPAFCVISGTLAAIEELASELEAQGVNHRRLQTSHAFHSEMMDPILEPFAERVKTITLRPPKIPYVSNTTGTWITDAQATNPKYWANHLRQTVHFGKGLATLFKEGEGIFIEVGPGRTLRTLALQHPDKTTGQKVLTSMRHPSEKQSDVAFLLNTLGRLWLAGIAVDWVGFYAHEQRRRLPLPTYPFERQRFWIDPPNRPASQTHIAQTMPEQAPTATHTRPDLDTVYVAPSGKTEHTLAEIWQQVLGIEQVGIHDSFFDLGGHSLQAVQLASKMSTALDRDIPAKVILEAPTISDLLKMLNHSDEKDSRGDGKKHVRVSQQETPPAYKAPPASESSTIQHSPFIEIERRPLLPLMITGKLPPVDAAALDYLPVSLLQASGLSRSQIIEVWCNNLPVLQNIWEVPWGRIAYIVVPRFSVDLYSDQQDAVQVVIEGLEIAKQVGAQVVSLTGIIPSATDYGHAIVKAMAGRSDLPLVTTGHATTTASVVMAIKRIVEESQRDLTKERVGFLGLGSIGSTTLRLMLRALPPPAEIILCDVYSKRNFLQRIAQELVDTIGFEGHVRIAESRAQVPPEIYEATLIVGATNVANILDIMHLKPGTLVVDDSAPHCFEPELAIRRFEQQHDILFTEGGMLQSDAHVRDVVYIPHFAAQVMTDEQLQAFMRPNPYQFWGCMFSSLLSARFENLEPTLGLVDAQTSLKHYTKLDELGIRAADLHCGRYELDTSKGFIRNLAIQHSTIK